MLTPKHLKSTEIRVNRIRERPRRGLEPRGTARKTSEKKRWKGALVDISGV